MTAQAGEPPVEKTEEQPIEKPRVVSSRDIFGDSKLVIIEHEGATYQLRITRRNKLILRK